MTQQLAVASRSTSVFHWDEVPDAVLRRLLKAALTDLEGPDSAADVRHLDRGGLIRNARHVLGRPPTKAKMQGPAVIEYLRGPWLRKEGRGQLETVVGGLSVGLRRQAPGSIHGRLQWLKRLNRTTTLALALRRAFILQYKSSRPVHSRPPAIGDQPAASSYVLRGQEVSARKLYDHQIRTHDELDRWLRGKAHGGLIVLPTGAGKTTTMVSWLLDWLAGSTDRRVLWLAHQRELVDQAAREFARAAESQSATFSLRLRVIRGGAAASSTLSERDLGVAVATMQSVRPNESPNRGKALRRFASTPTIVVVDEAHRAVSPTYRALLDVLEGCANVRVLGLTATPNPSGAAARRRMRDRFPTQLISVGPNELVAAQILARPVFHKVDTHVSVDMSVQEARRALTMDISDAVLRHLAVPVRNRILINTWLDDPARWGKTLVFATSIAHADELTALFEGAGVPARSVHSASFESPADTLDWFRTVDREAVLVSVGMLTEGVDLPMARTAFLARPTTSAVLLRQMIGRVLRGPRSNGTDIAHLVTFHDDWIRFTGVIEPIDLKDLPDPVHATDDAAPGRSLTLLRHDDSLPPAVFEQVRRLFLDHAAVASQGAFLSRADLVGYYETAEMRIPVFEHQRLSFDQLNADLLAGVSLQGHPPISYFEHDPLPHPSERHLSELVREVREFEARPTFVEYRLVMTPHQTAQEVITSGALTEDDRAALIRGGWDRGGELSYPTLDHWREAVDARIRELTRLTDAGVTKVDPETVTAPIKARTVVRYIEPLFQDTLRRAKDLLDSEDSRARLARPPKVRWSDRPLTTAHAHWRIAKAGPTITISRALQIARTHVSDELLRYLLWHELLHHVLPGHGHDAEFRMLEARWPNALDLDRELDTLHERIG